MAEADGGDCGEGAVSRGAFVGCGDSVAEDGGVGSPEHGLGGGEDEAAVEAAFGCVGEGLVNFGGRGRGKGDVGDHVIVDEVLKSRVETEGNEGDDAGDVEKKS